MKVVVAKYVYGKDAKIREYDVDDGFLEFLHMAKLNGNNEYNSLRYYMTDVLVNTFGDGAGAGYAWEHDDSISFGIARSKDAAVNHLVDYHDDNDYNDEEMATMFQYLKKAGANLADYQNRPTDENGDLVSREQKLSANKPMSSEDKDKLRSQAGIKRQ